mmetsp:Transcript_2/g.9  ORF Transcript_2/g.9 Transcript_2/m.9 type:complete len:209 (+) Transcript_2:1185-1811(+)
MPRTSDSAPSSAQLHATSGKPCCLARKAKWLKCGRSCARITPLMRALVTSSSPLAFKRRATMSSPTSTAASRFSKIRRVPTTSPCTKVSNAPAPLCCLSVMRASEASLDIWKVTLLRISLSEYSCCSLSSIPKPDAKALTGPSYRSTMALQKSSASLWARSATAWLCSMSSDIFPEPSCIRCARLEASFDMAADSSPRRPLTASCCEA